MFFGSDNDAKVFQLFEYLKLKTKPIKSQKIQSYTLPNLDKKHFDVNTSSQVNNVSNKYIFDIEDYKQSLKNAPQDWNFDIYDYENMPTNSIIFLMQKTLQDGDTTILIYIFKLILSSKINNNIQIEELNYLYNSVNGASQKKSINDFGYVASLIRSLLHKLKNIEIDSQKSSKEINNFKTQLRLKSIYCPNNV